MASPDLQHTQAPCIVAGNIYNTYNMYTSLYTINPKRHTVSQNKLNAPVNVSSDEAFAFSNSGNSPHLQVDWNQTQIHSRNISLNTSDSDSVVTSPRVSRGSLRRHPKIAFNVSNPIALELQRPLSKVTSTGVLQTAAQMTMRLSPMRKHSKDKLTQARRRSKEFANFDMAIGATGSNWKKSGKSKR